MVKQQQRTRKFEFHTLAPAQNRNILRKKAWTKNEDTKLRALVNKHGAQKWSFIANLMKDRVGKQCRERWHNHLNPKIRKGSWNEKEEWTLFVCHQLMGNKWAEISKHISGRTDNSIKNHWNSSMRKKISFYRKKLLDSVQLYKTAESRFNRRFNAMEKKIIKEIITSDLINKNWDQLDNKPASNKKLRKMNNEIGNKEHISLNLFEDVNKIDELIQSIDKNLISIPEMAALLDFINKHEHKIMKKPDGLRLGGGEYDGEKEGFKPVNHDFNTPGKIHNYNNQQKVPGEFKLFSNGGTPMKLGNNASKEDISMEQDKKVPNILNFSNFDVHNIETNRGVNSPKQTPFKKYVLSVMKGNTSPFDTNPTNKEAVKKDNKLIRSPFK